jgi:hypothetical protein
VEVVVDYSELGTGPLGSTKLAVSSNWLVLGLFIDHNSIQ